MSLDYLEPVSMEVLETINGLPDHVLGKNLEIFTNESVLPDILDFKICLIFILSSSFSNLVSISAKS